MLANNECGTPGLKIRCWVEGGEIDFFWDLLKEVVFGVGTHLHFLFYGCQQMFLVLSSVFHLSLL
jgi:hypothetical protein